MKGNERSQSGQDKGRREREEREKRAGEVPAGASAVPAGDTHRPRHARGSGQTHTRRTPREFT